MARRLVLLVVLFLIGCAGGGSLPKGPALAASEPVQIASGTVVAYTDPGDIPHLELAGDPKRKLPLEHTHVAAKLTGFVAEVEVSQTYTNPFPDPIEAVYVFPLPENSAVNHMRMVIGQRVIEADVMERQAARRTYEQAKAAGHTAALLEQERPNVFTQSVANLEPGKKIDVVVRYVQDLTYDAGFYEFVFPMVVGPRFVPGAPLEGPQSGTGTHADTGRVPDASRISPPIIGRGERTGHDISIELVADASLAVGQFQVPTHEVVARRPADGTLHITLAERESLPNRDFVLRYQVTDERPTSTLFVAPSPKGGGYFALVLHPPQLDVDQLVGRREIVFVVDVSGSMSGKPLAMCQAAMAEAISNLRPVDTFNIITFSGGSQQAFPSPVPANTANIRQAFEVVRGMSAGGGTMMADAVQVALSPAVASGRHRYVFFMTDGYVGNEPEIIAASGHFVEALEAKGQRARVFGFGVGSSTNRMLLDGISRAGKGVAVYATNREDPARAVNQFYRYIDRTALTDIEVQWGGLQVQEVYPSQMPDLFASHPLILHGRYQGQPDQVQVVGRAGKTRLTVPVAIRQAHPADVLGTLWARSKVGDLEERMWEGEDHQQEIIALGLEHDLVTRFTSLVAVDRSRVVGDGKPRTVVQPVEGPEDVDVEMAGGVRAPAGAGVKLEEAADQGVRFKAAARAPMAPAAPAAAPPAPGGYGYSKEADDTDGEAAKPEPAAPTEEPGPAYEPTETQSRTATAPVEPKRGCGCRAAGERSESGIAWLVALGALVAVARRRRS
jgi:Ca-activated chloride channel homolog